MQHARRSRFAAIVSVGLAASSAGWVSAQEYPNRPVRIVTAAAGGNGDFAARLITPGLSASLGQQVVVDNRPSGVLPGQIVSKAQPDGYTLLAYGSPIWLGPLLQSTPYDALTDFSPITLVSSAPNILVVHPQLPVKSVKELIALAKSKPEQLNYSSSATGGSSHLAMELFKSMAGVNIVRIPYKNGATEIADLAGGQVQLTIGTAASVRPHVKSAKLRALAVTSTQPTALFPGLPTIAAALPGYESVSMLGMFAPAKTSAAIVYRLNQEVVRILNQADVKEKFFSIGVDTVGSSSEELTARMKSEIARMGKVIKDAGIKEE